MERQANQHDMSESEPQHRARTMNVFGRQGSPTITLALPFSRVEVTADDSAPLVAELAALTARLARAVASLQLSADSATEFIAIADEADALISTSGDLHREAVTESGC